MIEFPEDELAQESVLPIFDKVEVVKDRRVKTGGRLELGLGGGLNLTEALYENKNFNFNATYHFTNIHAVNFMYFSMVQGLSAMGTDLAEGRGLIEGQKFDASLAPSPENFLLFNYQATAYYGKISLTKKTVINLTLHGLLGVTSVNFSDSSSVGFNFGVGQKLFFTNNFGLRMDLLALLFSGPDPTSERLNPDQGDTAVSSADLDETNYFPTFFNIGFIYIL